MKNIKKGFVSIFTVFTLLFSLFTPSYATNNVSEIIADVGKQMTKTVSNPQVGSVGGEWAVIGLARSGVSVPKNYFENYYKTVEKYVVSKKGVLHDKKYTEYSRIIIALSAIGKDATNVGGYDLTKALGDFDKTVWQGINGSVFGLIALDTRNYTIPKNPSAKTQATRELYIREILANQLPDGGWAFSGEKADPDMTAMTLQSLAKYKDRPEVKKAIDKGVEVLSKIQKPNGGYETFGNLTSESTAQVLLALTELGISINDKRFVKNNKTVLDDLLSYYKKGSGFEHIKGGGVNQMATEQAFYALVSLNRVSNGKTSLYRMTDLIARPKNTTKNTTKK